MIYKFKNDKLTIYYEGLCVLKSRLRRISRRNRDTLSPNGKTLFLKSDCSLINDNRTAPLLTCWPPMENPTTQCIFFTSSFLVKTSYCARLQIKFSVACTGNYLNDSHIILVGNSRKVRSIMWSRLLDSVKGCLRRSD